MALADGSFFRQNPNPVGLAVADIEPARQANPSREPAGQHRRSQHGAPTSAGDVICWHGPRQLRRPSAATVDGNLLQVTVTPAIGWVVHPHETSASPTFHVVGDRFVTTIESGQGTVRGPGEGRVTDSVRPFTQ